MHSVSSYMLYSLTLDCTLSIEADPTLYVLKALEEIDNCMWLFSYCMKVTIWSQRLLTILYAVDLKWWFMYTFNNLIIYYQIPAFVLLVFQFYNIITVGRTFMWSFIYALFCIWMYIYLCVLKLISISAWLPTPWCIAIFSFSGWNCWRKFTTGREIDEESGKFFWQRPP